MKSIKNYLDNKITKILGFKTKTIRINQLVKRINSLNEAEEKELLLTTEDGENINLWAKADKNDCVKRVVMLSNFKEVEVQVNAIHFNTKKQTIEWTW